MRNDFLNATFSMFLRPKQSREIFNRKQFCRVNGVNSKTKGIDVGVPQGSCLGPLLFLIYINGLPQPVQNSTVSMYADDTSLCYQSSDINELNEAINIDLKQLEIWLQGKKLLLNVAKTNSMFVATKQKHNILKNRNDDLDLKIRDNARNNPKNKVPWCADRQLSKLEGTHQACLYQSFKSYWLFKTCQDVPKTGDIENSSHRYCRATLSILLLCLGLRRFD